MIKLTEEQAKELHMEEAVDIDGVEYEVVEELDWEDEGKYSYGGYIFQRNDGEGPYYLLGVSRSGSYYSDYYYMYNLDCPECEKVPVTKMEWKVKK